MIESVFGNKSLLKHTIDSLCRIGPQERLHFVEYLNKFNC